MKLLRIEGINIYATVLDTDDLSTRRGSSLLLLQAISDVASHFSSSLTSISTGASVGLFVVKQNAPPDLVAKVREHLQTEKNYRHLTFVVDATEAEGFRDATESAIATNRWRQMQSFSTSLGDLAQSAHGACIADRVRPASPGSTEGYSASVQSRRNHGSDKKQEFYRHELDAIKDGKTPSQLRFLSYASDFQTISDKLDPAWGFSPNIKGKIGVLYADGNRFGRIAQDCKNEQELADWDKHLKSLRRTWLRDLLQTASTSRRWFTHNSDTKKNDVRLETLLWGGDEFTLVVPAWCAMEVAQHFMRFTADWQYNDKPLTHACGLVMCHANAPIGPITKLAQDLAELGKKAPVDADGVPPPNSLHWLTLESFDHAGSDLNGLLKTRFNKKITKWDNLSLSPTGLQALSDFLPTLKDVLPRSTLTRAVRLLLQGIDNHALLVRSYSSVHEAVRLSKQLAKFNFLWKALSGEAWSVGDEAGSNAPAPATGHLAAWVTLLELWDYLPLISITPDTPPRQATTVETT